MSLTEVMVAHHSSVQVTQHTLAAASVGVYSAVILGWLQPISLILSTAAATASLITMIMGGFAKWSENRARLRAEEIKAKATVEAAGVKAQAEVVKAALEASTNKSDAGTPENLTGR